MEEVRPGRPKWVTRRIKHIHSVPLPVRGTAAIHVTGHFGVCSTMHYTRELNPGGGTYYYQVPSIEETVTNTYQKDHNQQQ